MTTKIRAYYDRDSFSHPGEFFEEKSLAQQHFAVECDINTIMDKYVRTGVLPQIPGAEFLDTVDAPSYHEAWNTIVEAEERFNALPSRIRERFDNDASKFLEFFENPDNLDEARELGFIEPSASPEAPAQPPLDVTVPTDT
ncbi:MAG: internal scaffolding protein [Microvirus sp.]|nr:MAG: internal scaffolding protein [Microvirus sp.]